MSILEDLVGCPLHEMSEEDLENAIMKGRVAREQESDDFKLRARVLDGKMKAKKKKEPEISDEELAEFD